ncbi:MAG: SUMF1/EgtB/PvdO family nonheme iron enzyme [Nitrospirota bacterium]|nr:SUMF1/EgtB/PvdO family nonheme iron enzyme [Nitrospirota bacterium]MDP2384037.1 SUMF1/EgtB/PvdO family nonheme iron enzyme [Nitrospirota bacterium]
MNRSRALLATVLVSGVTMLAGPSYAEESLIPKDMVYIGQGPSVMGIDKQAPVGSGKQPTAYDKRMKGPQSAEAFQDEGPAHMVFLDSYLMDTYEVSNKDYGEFVKTKGHPAPAYWDDPRLNKPGQPVVGVNWDDAKSFCAYRGKRLPTEAEWEKAARGPKASLYPWGNDFDPAKVNYGKNHDATMPVDSYPEGVSYYGVYNLAGNVFEWVSDWYDPRYYDRLETMVNPAGPAKAVWIGGTGTYVDRLTVGEKRVIRGGSWIAPEGTVRATHRFWNHPLNNSYGVGLGFRCAKSAPPEIEQQIRDSYIAALVDMGRERFTEATQAVAKGLAIDPKNLELLELRLLIEQSMKRS